MALSKITTKGILDGTIKTADLANNSVTTVMIQDDAVNADKLANDITFGGFFQNKDGTSTGVTSGKDALFRVNTNTTTGNVTIAASNNASVTGPLTIANGTTLSIASTGRLVIL